jgi:hypothetical protein
LQLYVDFGANYTLSNLVHYIAQKPGLLTRAAAAASKGALPSTPIDLTATLPISVEDDGLNFNISARDEHERRKVRLASRLAISHAEIVLANAEIKAGQMRLKYAKREYQAVADDMTEEPPESTDGEPRTKRPKSSRGRGGKGKAPQVTAIPRDSKTATTNVKGKGKARDDTA